MKYKVITTKCLFGEIIVNAKNKDEAQQKAYDIAKNNEYKWHEEEKIDIHEIHEVPLLCSKCGVQLPLGSLFCNKCGTKTES